jgi:hypothetical protein
VYFDENSLEIENFYHVDAVGVHSFHRGILFPFPESSIAIAMVRVQRAPSPMLATSHGHNHLTILQVPQNDQSVSILFNQAIPVPTVDGVTQRALLFRFKFFVLKLFNFDVSQPLPLSMRRFINPMGLLAFTWCFHHLECSNLQSLKNTFSPFCCVPFNLKLVCD